MTNIIPSVYCKNIDKMVLNQCSRKEDGGNGGNNNDHSCPVCGSTETLHGSQTYEMSPVHVEFFHDLILALTMEVCGGGGCSSDNSTLDEEDVQNFICEKCMAKFVMLESLQREIAHLGKKVEEILSELRKKIRNHQRVISQSNLSDPVTKPEAIVHTLMSDLDEEDKFEESLQMMIAEAENEEDDKDVECEPIIPDFQDEVLDVQKNHEDAGVGDDPMGGVDSMSDEQSMNVIAHQGGQDQLIPNKSRRCKVAATQLISIILRDDNPDDDDDDDNGNDEYSPNAESETDSDSTDELELDSDTQDNLYKHNVAGIPSDAPTKLKNQNDKHICEVCGKEVKHLLQHMKTHTRSHDKWVPCETGQKTVPTQPNVKNVNRKKVLLQQFRYTCEKCGQGYHNPKRLQAHLNRHFPSTGLDQQRKFICPICKAACLSIPMLQYHTRQVHNREKRIECPNHTCKKRFHSEKNLHRHLEHYHPPREEETGKFSCTFCNEEFSTVLERLAHIKSSHICQFCDKSFPQKEGLDEHKGTIHHSVDRLQLHVRDKCEYYKCRKRSNLRTHLKITDCNPDKDERDRAKRAGHKYYSKYKSGFEDAKSKSSLKCEVCVRTYSNKQNLNRHISKRHSNVYNK